mgnify:CR=1 FL=1
MTAAEYQEIAARAEARGFLDWCIKKKRPTFGLSDRAWLVCDSFKRAWRYGHPAIASFWKELQEAAVLAVSRPGVTFTCRMLKLRRDGAWLRIRGPSGRCLCYLHPRVEADGQITYAGVNQYTHKWGRIKTYGGKLSENLTQAFARDVLGYNMPAIDESGYEIVLSVHDELLTETDDTEDYTSDGLAAFMSTVPPWAQGLPLDTSVQRAREYILRAIAEGAQVQTGHGHGPLNHGHAPVAAHRVALG